jgi:hypothetical protein
MVIKNEKMAREESKEILSRQGKYRRHGRLRLKKVKKTYLTTLRTTRKNGGAFQG